VYLGGGRAVDVQRRQRGHQRRPQLAVDVLRRRGGGVGAALSAWNSDEVSSAPVIAAVPKRADRKEERELTGMTRERADRKDGRES
jgi:hypothetical protein